MDNIKTSRQLCEAVCLEVACERNEPEDIMFGGPVMLGYTFYVLKNDDVKNIISFIVECLNKYNRPYISTSVVLKKNFNTKYLMTRENIEEIIKTTSI